jgi:predicted transcriptional regulator
MEVVWDRGEASVRDVMEALNVDAPKERAYTTYMTIMARLDAKGMLERRRQGKTDFYTPTCARDRYADLRARAELEAVVDHYGDVALTHICAADGGARPASAPPSTAHGPREVRA